MPYAYAFILLATVVLSWESNVTEIISYASRAFALYYFLQGVLALLMARQRRDTPGRQALLWRFAGVSAGCLMVFLLGIPAE